MCMKRFGTVAIDGMGCTKTMGCGEDDAACSGADEKRSGEEL